MSQMCLNLWTLIYHQRPGFGSGTRNVKGPFWFVKVVSGYWTISSICYTSMSHFTFQLNCENMLLCNHPVCWLSGVNNLLLGKIGSCLFAGVCLNAGHAVLKRIFILGRIEYQILFVWWKLNELNIEYYSLIKKIFEYYSNTWKYSNIFK